MHTMPRASSSSFSSSNVPMAKLSWVESFDSETSNARRYSINRILDHRDSRCWPKFPLVQLQHRWPSSCFNSEIGINSARKKTSKSWKTEEMIAIIFFPRDKKERTPFELPSSKSNIWTGLTTNRSFIRDRYLAKSWLRVDSKASNPTRIRPWEEGGADGFRKITFWFCSICRREIIRSWPLPNTFQIVRTSALRYLEQSMRAYGIVAVFFVAKFDGGHVPSRHDCSIKRFTGERPRNRLPALPSFFACSLCRCGSPTSGSNSRLLKEDDSRIAK